MASRSPAGARQIYVAADFLGDGRGDRSPGSARRMARPRASSWIEGPLANRLRGAGWPNPQR